MKVEKGFTLVEILVALVLFGIISGVIFTTMISSLGLSSQSQKQINSSSRVQQIIENVRSAWSTTDGYNNACVANFSPALPTGYTAKFINLDSRAGTLGTASDIPLSSSSTCSAPSNANVTIGGITASPPMRRVIVSSGTGQQDTTLTIDILGPQ